MKKILLCLLWLPFTPAKAQADLHPCKTLSYWKRYNHEKNPPLREKLAPAPAELIELLNQENAELGFPNHPIAAPLTPEFKADFQSAIDEIPADIQARVNAKVVGIFVVDDLGGTGFTDIVRDDRGKETAGFVILDRSVLTRKANEWATWKESSTFKIDPPFALRMEIEPPSADDRKNALEFILLHEFGHVLSIGAGLHPSWDRPPQPGNYSFLPISWIVFGKGFAALEGKQFPERAELRFYLGPKPNANGAILGGERIQKTYANLENTRFPTLYGATNPYDDFAESFASYVHVALLHKPYRVEVLKDGKPVQTFGSCWEAARCRRKRLELERLLGRAP